MKLTHAVKHLLSTTDRVRTQGVFNQSSFKCSVAALLLTGAGIVSTDELPSILTSLGYSATEEDVAAQTHQVACLLARRLSLPLLSFVGAADGSTAWQISCACRAG